MASVPKNEKRQTGVNVRAHLELIFDLAGVGLWVQPADVVVNGSELTHWYGCVSTQTCFQDGIVNKHILLLHQSKMSSGVKISFTEIQNWLMQANSTEPACSPWTGPQCLTVAVSNDSSGIDDAVGQSCIKSFQADNKLKHSNVNTTFVCFVYEYYLHACAFVGA